MRGRRVWLLVLLFVGGTSLAAFGFIAVATPVGHRPLHIGCLHHNHGPKWHDGHSRAIGLPRSRFARPDPEDAAGLPARSIR